MELWGDKEYFSSKLDEVLLQADTASFHSYFLIEANSSNTITEAVGWDCLWLGLFDSYIFI